MKKPITKTWVTPQLKGKPISFECTAYAGASTAR